VTSQPLPAELTVTVTFAPSRGSDESGRPHRSGAVQFGVYEIVDRHPVVNRGS